MTIQADISTHPVQSISEAPPVVSEIKEEFEEVELKLEAGGIRLTIVMQSFPGRLMHAEKLQQYLAGEILKVWWAANSVDKYKKAIL